MPISAYYNTWHMCMLLLCSDIRKLYLPIVYINVRVCPDLLTLHRWPSNHRCCVVHATSVCINSQIWSDRINCMGRHYSWDHTTTASYMQGIQHLRFPRTSMLPYYRINSTTIFDSCVYMLGCFIKFVFILVCGASNTSCSWDQSDPRAWGCTALV